MKKILKLLAGSVLAGSVLVSSMVTAKEEIVATYKGGEVKASAIMKKVKPLIDNDPNLRGKTFSELDKKIQTALIHDFVNAKLIKNEAKQAKIENTKDFQQQLSEIKKDLAIRIFVKRYIDQHVTGKDIKEAYDKYIAALKGKKQVKAKHILVNTEKEAKDIKQRIKKGEKFNTLAKKHSKDLGTKDKGGELDYFTPDQIDPNFAIVAFSLKKGQVSDPVKSNAGWHIIEFIDQRDYPIPTEAEAYNGLKQNLGQEALLKYIEELNKKYNVKILVK